MVAPRTEPGAIQSVTLRWVQTRKWAFWRSPDDQPGWARPALLGTAAVAALLYTWNITSSELPTLYLAAARSMSESWKAFFYGALDPGATITIDKIPGSFIPQALSARIFGFHPWSVTLPQVIEGVVAVLVMYRVVRRWQGPVAGLVAAGLFAATPVLASMFGQTMEDSLLIMCLVLAADAFARALARARLGWLVLAGVWVGIGFQAKMLEAWMVLPAFVLTYLIVAPGGWRRRVGQVSVAGVVLVAVSLSWLLLIAVTPAHHRPYVDGSTSNSAFPMVFGYNGLDRFGIHIPGAARPLITSGGHSGSAQQPAGRPGHGPPGQRPSAQGAPKVNAGPTGSTKLFSGTYGTQVGWLYPLALLAFVLGLVRTRRAPRTDPVRSGFILWGLWLLTYGVMYSRMALPHTAYVAALAPPIAALAAAGIAMTWTAYRDGTARWALPAVIAAETGWSIYLSSRYSTFLPWLIWVVTAVAVVSLTVLIAAMLTARVRYAALIGGMAAGTAAMIAAPVLWSASVLDPGYRGSSFDASAGPGGAHLGPDGSGNAATAGTLDPPEQRLDDYLTSRRGGATFIAAADSWQTAESYIIATGQAFLPIGGFTGAVPYPTLTKIRQLINGGQLRYVLIGPDGGLNIALHMGVTGTSAGAILGWVRAFCTTIPAAAYGGAAAGTIYDCKP